MQVVSPRANHTGAAKYTYIYAYIHILYTYILEIFKIPTAMNSQNYLGGESQGKSYRGSKIHIYIHM